MSDAGCADEPKTKCTCERVVSNPVLYIETFELESDINTLEIRSVKGRNVH